MKFSKRSFVSAVLGCSVSVLGADYHVAATGDDGNDGSAQAPFATIDRAIAAATDAADVIHVAAGEYATTTQWGPQLKARLVGEGATRDDVVIRSSGEFRTLRLSAESWIENVTIVGSGRRADDSVIADKGGAVEMSGGTVTNCVVRDGVASNAGGNIWMGVNAGTVTHSLITNGTAGNSGGNLSIESSGSKVVDCVITHGAAMTADVWDRGGGNVLIKDTGGQLTRCEIAYGRLLAGTSANCGGVRVMTGAAVVEDCHIHDNANGGLCISYEGKYCNNTVVGNGMYGVYGYSGASGLGDIVNCVVYGNGEAAGAFTEWKGNRPDGKKGSIRNCAFGSDRISGQDVGDFTNCKVITAEAFVDPDGGDYRPQAGGALEDAGTADPRGLAASVTDLDGNPRRSGTVDIGCYEVQKSVMTVHVDSTAFEGQVFAPATVTFAHSVMNSTSAENVVYTYDFGDGTATASTREGTIRHVYAEPGVYTVAITANNAQEEFAEAVYEGYVKVASLRVYLTPGNTGAAFPYDTPETGYARIQDAVRDAYDGSELLLGDGVYEVTDQVDVQKAITIRGLGATPEAVILRNTSANRRTMQVGNADARIENLTLENGTVVNLFGANLRASAGTVTNCIIRGGLATTGGTADGNAAGSAVELAGAAVITHCVITNNTVLGSSRDAAQTGGAVYLPYGSKNGKLLNCLIAYNTYATSGTETKIGAAGIRFYGSNDNTLIENCSVVSNVVTGVGLSDTSAGIYCTTWNARIFNCVIAGNHDEGRGGCTSVKIDSHTAFANNLTDDAAAYSANNFVAPLASLFKDFAGGDFRPAVTGPLCNRGRAALAAAGVDLAGKPRVFGTAIDIGCYENQLNPGVAIVFR